MTTPAAETVEVRRRIAASRETVFAYFTDPERYRLWQGVDAELDPRPGGIFRVTVTGRSHAVARGTFLVVEPPERLVFTWGWEDNALLAAVGVPPGSSRVEVTLLADGDGTLLLLRHSALTTDASRGFHSWGWHLSVDRLVSVAEGHDPGPDPLADL